MFSWTSKSWADCKSVSRHCRLCVVNCMRLSRLTGCRKLLTLRKTLLKSADFDDFSCFWELLKVLSSLKSIKVLLTKEWKNNFRPWPAAQNTKTNLLTPTGHTHCYYRAIAAKPFEISACFVDINTISSFVNSSHEIFIAKLMLMW